MKIIRVTDEHIPAAIRLAVDDYNLACQHLPVLATAGIETVLAGAITDLVRHGQVIAALDDGQLVGYMGFLGPYTRFFGSGTGSFSPLHGHAASGPDRSRLYSLLFQHSAELLTARGNDTFAVTTYSRDREAASAFALNGFGIRCTDAIRDTSPLANIIPVPGISFEEVSRSDTSNLLSLKNGLVRHLRQSPTFVAAEEFTTDTFAALCEQRTSRFFVARDGKAAIGYMEITDEGENVLTSAPDMQNICGAFLEDPYRGRGIYRGLLDMVIGTLRQEGVKRLGVDFETMNPTALHFWGKDFISYTHSFARRIDDLG